jgi:preprotein translocase subunit SecG
VVILVIVRVLEFVIAVVLIVFAAEVLVRTSSSDGSGCGTSGGSGRSGYVY